MCPEDENELPDTILSIPFPATSPTLCKIHQHHEGIKGNHGKDIKEN